MPLNITYTGSNPRLAKIGEQFKLQFRIDTIPDGAMKLSLTVQTAGVTFLDGKTSTTRDVSGAGAITPQIVLTASGSRMVSLDATITKGTISDSTNVNIDLS